MRRCERCGAEALWAVQSLDGGGTISITLLGSHYRGFPLQRLCDTCKESILAAATLSVPELIDAVSLLQPYHDGEEQAANADA